MSISSRNRPRVRASGRRSCRKACVPSNRPAIRFLDILDNIRLIESYLLGMDRAAFDADSRTRDAVERCLETFERGGGKTGRAGGRTRAGAAVAGGEGVRERASP